MTDIFERLKSYEPLFGEYLVDICLGVGSSGSAYKLKHKENPDLVSVVKIITIPDENTYHSLYTSKRSGRDIGDKIDEIVAKYCREVEFLEKFKGYKNIVEIKNYDIREADDLRRDLLIQMDYLTDLHKYSENHELDEKEIIRLGIEMCGALEEIQKYNIIHRDIKPQNIFVSPDGHYQLGDFGIARNIQADTIATEVGTPLYMSPEIFNRKKIDNGDKKVDLYSLGLVLYEMLNGWKLPFEDESTSREEANIRRLSGEAIPFIPERHIKLSIIICNACSYSRKDRYDDVTELKRHLQTYLEGDRSVPILDEIRGENEQAKSALLKELQKDFPDIGTEKKGKIAVGQPLNLENLFKVEGSPILAKKDLKIYLHEGHVRIPGGFKAIAAYTFEDRTDLTYAEIPYSVKEIGRSAFQGCTGIGSMVLPLNLQEIGAYAFRDCVSLGIDGASFVIPDSVTSIGTGAFMNCANLTGAVISKNLKKLPDEIFKGCKNLRSIVIPDSVESVGHNIFCECCRLTDITFSKNMQIIEESMFFLCSDLTDVIIPDNITVIESNAFSYSGLKNITIPDSVAKIAYDAFTYCGHEAFDYDKDDDFTVHCSADSYAFQYCIENDITVFLSD